MAGALRRRPQSRVYVNLDFSVSSVRPESDPSEGTLAESVIADDFSARVFQMLHFMIIMIFFCSTMISVDPNVSLYWASVVGMRECPGPAASLASCRLGVVLLLVVLCVCNIICVCFSVWALRSSRVVDRTYALFACGRIGQIHAEAFLARRSGRVGALSQWGLSPQYSERSLSVWTWRGNRHGTLMCDHLRCVCRRPLNALNLVRVMINLHVSDRVPFREVLVSVS